MQPTQHIRLQVVLFKFLFFPTHPNENIWRAAVEKNYLTRTGSAKQCTSDKKKYCTFYFVGAAIQKSNATSKWATSRTALSVSNSKKKIVVRLNTSSLWNEWFEGNEKKKKKAHATQMSHFISFPCYLRCWLEWKEYCVLYIFFRNSRFFFCHAIISIFIVYEKPNIGLMQGCVCCLSESIILEIAASEFLSQNGNKLLLYCCQMTPRK